MYLSRVCPDLYRDCTVFNTQSILNICIVPCVKFLVYTVLYYICRVIFNTLFHIYHRVGRLDK